MITMTVSGSGVRYLGGGAITGIVTGTGAGGGVVMETGVMGSWTCLREEGTPVVSDLK